MAIEFAVQTKFNTGGSDTAKHYAKGTASEQHASAGKADKGTPTRRVGQSIVGTGKPGTASPKSIVK
jgi:hypothetical protein